MTQTPVYLTQTFLRWKPTPQRNFPFLNICLEKLQIQNKWTTLFNEVCFISFFDEYSF